MSRKKGAGNSFEALENLPLSKRKKKSKALAEAFEFEEDETFVDAVFIPNPDESGESSCTDSDSSGSSDVVDGSFFPKESYIQKSKQYNNTQKKTRRKPRVSLGEWGKSI